MQSLVVASMPLSMELAMEISFPACEGVVGRTAVPALLTVLCRPGGRLGLHLVQHLHRPLPLSLLRARPWHRLAGSDGLHCTALWDAVQAWVLPASCLLSIPLLALVQVQYGRAQLDASTRQLEQRQDKYGTL